MRPFFQTITGADADFLYAGAPERSRSYTNRGERVVGRTSKVISQELHNNGRMNSVITLAKSICILHSGSEGRHRD
jgi:hypothetical protein